MLKRALGYTFLTVTAGPAVLVGVVLLVALTALPFLILVRMAGSSEEGFQFVGFVVLCLLIAAVVAAWNGAASLWDWWTTRRWLRASQPKG